MEYELDLTSEDIGEMVTIIRVKVLKLHVAPFAQRLGITEKVLLDIEDGKGPHGMKVIKKISEMYPNISVSLNVKVKKG
jgi:hypothetical protein